MTSPPRAILVYTGRQSWSSNGIGWRVWEKTSRAMWRAIWCFKWWSLIKGSKLDPSSLFWFPPENGSRSPQIWWQTYHHLLDTQPSLSLWIFSPRWFTLLYVPRRLVLSNMPNFLWTLCFDCIERLGWSYQIGVQGSLANSGRKFSRSSGRISDLAQRFILKYMVRVRWRLTC